MIDRADRDSVDRNPDAQAPPSTIASNKVAKLPHPPADQVGTYAYQPVSLRRRILTLSAIIQTSTPRRSPACVLDLAASLANHADCTLQMPSQLPQNRQNRVECIAVQCRYWTLKAASSRPYQVMSCLLNWQ